MWRVAASNKWYQWAHYTSRKQTKDECVICAYQDPKLMIVLFPQNLKDCRRNGSYKHLGSQFFEDWELDPPGQLICPAWCYLAYIIG